MGVVFRLLIDSPGCRPIETLYVHQCDFALYSTIMSKLYNSRYNQLHISIQYLLIPYMTKGSHIASISL